MKKITFLFIKRVQQKAVIISSSVKQDLWDHGGIMTTKNILKYTWYILSFIAICDGKTVFTGACNKYYPNDYQKTKDKGIVRSSGGSCSSPDTCTNCNDGFYSNGPYCESKWYKYFSFIIS